MDYTPIYSPGVAFTATASAAITGGHLVEVSGPGSVGPAAADSAMAVGVAGNDAATNAPVTVHQLGGLVHELVAGTGGVTAGQAVKVGAAASTVLPVAVGDPDTPVGIALTSAAAGAKVKVLGAGVHGAGGVTGTALFASTSLNFPSVAAGGQQELTITVTGAAVGDAVALAPPAAPEAGLVWSGRVSAANTVTVRVTNVTASAVDPAAATWGAHVLKH